MLSVKHHAHAFECLINNKMAIAVLLCYPLTFSGFTVPAYLFCIPFMISIRKHYCSLPTAFFLSSVCQSTDVETIRCFLNACIICCASGDIQAPAMEERYRVSPSLNTLLQFLVYVYSLQPSRVIV